MVAIPYRFDSDQRHQKNRTEKLSPIFLVPQYSVSKIHSAREADREF